MKKIRINFVCLGNICRSPMAEFIAADLLKRRGLDGVISVFSSAVSYEEEGNPVDRRALNKLKNEGVAVYPHYANTVTRDYYVEYDLFVCMEGYQVSRLKRLFDGDKENKVSLLLSYIGQNKDIDDPWYSGNFDAAYSEIKQGVEALIDYVQANSL